MAWHITNHREECIMREITVHSHNQYFNIGAEAILAELSTALLATLPGKLLVSDSLTPIKDKNKYGESICGMILFVKNKSHIAIVNHFSFPFSVMVIHTGEPLSAIKKTLELFLCQLNRYHHSGITFPCHLASVWLTRCEMDTLARVCIGDSPAAIAASKNITLKSVANYKANALKKLQSNLSIPLICFLKLILQLQAMNTV